MFSTKLSRLSCIRMVMLTVSLLPVLVMASGSSVEFLPKPVSKPMSPVSVDIVYQQAAVDGEVFEFDVLLHSAVDASVVSLQIDLPDGTSLQFGELNWSGTLLRDEKKSFSLRVLLPSRTSQASNEKLIVAKAVIGTFDAPQFAARAIYNAGTRTVFYAAATSSKPRTVMRNGKRVVEHVLQ